MSRRTIGLVLTSLAVAALDHRPVAAGQLATPLQTQSIPMTPTDWGPGTPGVTDPLVFRQFDPGLGTLDAVEVTLKMTIHNDFILIFTTHTPTTLSVATTETSNPNILSNPTLVQQLTDGPTVTLKAPDGLTPLFGAPGTTLPVDVVSVTDSVPMNESRVTWSSKLPSTDPHFIPPSEATLSFASTLDPTNAGSLLAQFIGTGTIDLPITAVAHSSFYSSSGNGGGAVLTGAGATVTIQYIYTAASVPEPSGLLLLGLGAGVGVLAIGRCRHAGRPEMDTRPSVCWGPATITGRSAWRWRSDGAKAECRSGN